MEIPTSFCWTRFGTEAGQGIGDILARKEAERIANDGLFLWGIGNALGPSMLQLLSTNRKPEVLFSPIKSGPRKADVQPGKIAIWGAATTLWGKAWALPPFSMVTSSMPSTSRKTVHYALVCQSDETLQFGNAGEEVLDFSALRNLATGRPVGASQVTCIVTVVQGRRKGSVYPVCLRARLVAPYFVVLREPTELRDEEANWTNVVRSAWNERIRNETCGC